MAVDISSWLQSQYARPYNEHQRGMISISQTAVPPWWRTFALHYERFSNSMETFLNSSEIDRLICAETLTVDFQNMTRTILDRVYGDHGEDDWSSTSAKSKWAMSMSRSSSTSSKSSLHYQNQHRPHNQIRYSPPDHQQNTSVQDSAESPYSSPVYSYSCPSSIGRMTYTQHLEGISLSLDALYFLIQAAQDLTDLSPPQIRQQRLDTLQLNPNSLRLVDLPYQLSITIYAVIRKLVSWDHGLIRKRMERDVFMGQLEELCGWVDEDGEMPNWRLGECFEELKRIREWRKAKARSVWGAIWDWIIL